MRQVINGILIFGLIILFRFFYIQTLKANLNSEEISNLTQYQKKIKGDRGIIYDRNGVPLAENITKGDFWVNTNKDIDIYAIANFFYKYYDSDSSITINYLKSKKTDYLPIKRNVLLDKIDEISAAVKSIKGLQLDKYNQRFYRYGDICSHVLGYVDMSGNGKAGIEYQFNDHAVLIILLCLQS